MDFYSSPTYSVKYYKEGLYKLVKFETFRGCGCGSGVEKKERSHEEKLSASLSRARSVVYQLAVCNQWQYFFTGTLSPDGHDRHNQFAFQNRFAQFIRDLRKKPGYKDLAYMMVFEQHKDGAWHMHGLLSGLPDSAVSSFVPGIHPKKLIDGGYLNWRGYSHQFGFCSLAPVKDADAVAGYLVKYITKDMASSVSDIGRHLYTCSRGLRRAVPFGDIYGSLPVLDCKLEYFGPYCSTGYVRDVSWSFWLDYIDLSDIEFFGSGDDAVDLIINSPEFEQLLIAGFPAGQGRGHTS